MTRLESRGELLAYTNWKRGLVLRRCNSKVFFILGLLVCIQTETFADPKDPQALSEIMLNSLQQSPFQSILAQLKADGGGSLWLSGASAITLFQQAGSKLSGEPSPIHEDFSRLPLTVFSNLSHSPSLPLHWTLQKTAEPRAFPYGIQVIVSASGACELQLGTGLINAALERPVDGASIRSMIDSNVASDPEKTPAQSRDRIAQTIEALVQLGATEEVKAQVTYLNRKVTPEGFSLTGALEARRRLEFFTDPAVLPLSRLLPHSTNAGSLYQIMADTGLTEFSGSGRGRRQQVPRPISQVTNLASAMHFGEGGQLVKDSRNGSLRQKNGINNPLLLFLNGRTKLRDIPIEIRRSMGLTDDFRFYHRTDSAKSLAGVTSGNAFTSAGKLSLLGGNASWGEGVYLSVDAGLLQYGSHLASTQLNPEAILGVDVDIFVGDTDGVIAITKNAAAATFQKEIDPSHLYPMIRQALVDNKPDVAIDLMHQIPHLELPRLGYPTDGAPRFVSVDLYLAERSRREYTPDANSETQLELVREYLRRVLDRPEQVSARERAALRHIRDRYGMPSSNELNAYLDRAEPATELRSDFVETTARLSSVITNQQRLRPRLRGTRVESGFHAASDFYCETLENASAEAVKAIGRLSSGYALRVAAGYASGLMDLVRRAALDRKGEGLEYRLRQILLSFSEAVHKDIFGRIRKDPERFYREVAEFANLNRRIYLTSEDPVTATNSLLEAVSARILFISPDREPQLLWNHLEDWVDLGRRVELMRVPEIPLKDVSLSSCRRPALKRVAAALNTLREIRSRVRIATAASSGTQVITDTMFADRDRQLGLNEYRKSNLDWTSLPPALEPAVVQLVSMELSRVGPRLDDTAQSRLAFALQMLSPGGLAQIYQNYGSHGVYGDSINCVEASGELIPPTPSGDN